MSRKLKFITCLPSDDYFIWQVHMWIESLKNINLSDKAIVLICQPKGRPDNLKWNKLIKLYPETTFITYKDKEGKLNSLLPKYIPILRPYLMERYCLDNPGIKNDAVFYCDSDIIFTESFNINDYIDDDINYLSNTNSYINATYFDSKIKDVMPHMLSEYKKIDVLNLVTAPFNINREICTKNNLNSGGAQYLLKNIDADFWKKVFDTMIPLKESLQNINKIYFESENKGIQSWTSDMWAVLWTIWGENKETKIISELDFAWSTDNVSKLEKCSILHNAGVSGKFMNNIPYFYKGHYHQGKNPLNDEHLNIVLNNKETKKTCNWVYANMLKELHNKYKLDY